MEALRELERVQRVLSLMSSRGFGDTGGAAADRFLAQFLLFMVRPADSLSLEKKFLLVSELLGKVTPDALEEVEHLTRLEADQDISSGALIQPSKKFKTHAEKSTIQAAPMVGFDAMTRARSTLEDFVCFLAVSPETYDCNTSIMYLIRDPALCMKKKPCLEVLGSCPNNAYCHGMYFSVSLLDLYRNWAISCDAVNFSFPRSILSSSVLS
ncbi:unnamed protein product [Urochloa humidicola]